MGQRLAIESKDTVYLIMKRTKGSRLGFTLMGNHYHAVMKFPLENRAEFLRAPHHRTQRQGAIGFKTSLGKTSFANAVCVDPGPYLDPCVSTCGFCRNRIEQRCPSSHRATNNERPSHHLSAGRLPAAFAAG